MVEETIYLGADNTIDLQLLEGGTALADHSLITRVVAELLGTLTLDSDANPEYFDLTNSDRLVLKLGSAPLHAGRYWMRLTVYDAAYVNGRAWEPVIQVEAV